MQNEGFAPKLDELPGGVFRLSHDLRTLYVNRLLGETLGLPAGLHALDPALRNPKLAVLLEVARQVLQTRAPLTTRVRLPGEDTLDAMLHLAPHGADGAAVVGMVHLVPAARTAPTVADALAAFVANTPAVMWIKDAQGRYLFANSAFESKFNFRRGAWQGLTDFELWPRRFAEACRGQEVAVLKSGLPRLAEGPSPTAERPTDWLLLRFPFGDGAGNRLIGGIATELVRHRRAEAGVKPVERTQPVLVWMKDSRGRYVFVSADFETQLGVPRGKALGLTDFDLWPTALASKMRDSDELVFKQARSVELNETLPEADGRLRSWKVYKFPFQRGTESFVGGVAVETTAPRRS